MKGCPSELHDCHNSCKGNVSQISGNAQWSQDPGRPALCTEADPRSGKMGVCSIFFLTWQLHAWPVGDLGRLGRHGQTQGTATILRRPGRAETFTNMSIIISLLSWKAVSGCFLLLQDLQVGLPSPTCVGSVPQSHTLSDGIRHMLGRTQSDIPSHAITHLWMTQSHAPQGPEPCGLGLFSHASLALTLTSMHVHTLSSKGVRLSAAEVWEEESS